MAEEKEERRRESDNLVLEILNHVQEMFTQHSESEVVRYDSIQTKIEELKNENEQQYSSLVKKLDDQNDIQHQLLKAFPMDQHGEPDLVGHCNAHEAMIKAAQAQEKFWGDLKDDMTKNGIIWTIRSIIVLAILGAIAKFKGLI